MLNPFKPTNDDETVSLAQLELSTNSHRVNRYLECHSTLIWCILRGQWTSRVYIVHFCSLILFLNLPYNMQTINWILDNKANKNWSPDSSIISTKLDIETNGGSFHICIQIYKSYTQCNLSKFSSSAIRNIWQLVLTSSNYLSNQPHPTLDQSQHRLSWRKPHIPMYQIT